ncbi:MAG TPA: phytoene desaturase family protein, partial [Polyangiales bacterium]|nr:phytoene desaturase family protein [Polyangiales bacterium]
MSQDVKRAAVVGSGFGGLAVAIRLQNAGVQTVLFERADKPGGRAYVYEDQGFTFDAGPTVITAPECLEELFTDAGRSLSDYVELMPVTPFYRLFWQDGSRLDYDGAGMVEEIRRLAPADEQGYLAFVDYARKVFDKGYTELAATPFLRFSDMVKVAPALIKLRADRSVYDTVCRFVKDERLRQALSFHTLLVGGNPLDTSSIYTLIHYLERKWGVFFPRGGTSALVQGLVRLFESLGGKLELCAPVERVRVDRSAGRVRHHVLVRGAERAFDLVVSNADLHHTYKRLFAGEPAAEREVRRLESLEWSMSLFV